MQAAIYTRISRDRAGAGLGVERQEQDCRELAGSLGWTVVNVFSDNDVTAFSGRRRPGYEALCEALKSGQADAVIVWHTDRLHRRPVELEDFIAICETRNVSVKTVKSGELDLSNSTGRMVARMLGASARHEVEHLIERAKRAKEQAAIEGKFRGGRRSFGYDANGMETVHEEAAAIRSAADAVLTGVSLRQIARDWNAKGLKTSYGQKEFSSKEVKKVLLRPRNAGIVLHEGNRIGIGRWEAILDADTFAALEAVLRDPARSRSAGFERKFQGSGIYLCGKCGDKLRISMNNYTHNSGWRHTYTCSAASHLGRNAELLDEYIDTLVIGHLSQPDAAIVVGGQSGEEAAALHAEREGLRARLDALSVLFAAGDVDVEQLKLGSAELRARMDGIDQQLAAAKSASALTNLVLSGDRLATTWAATSPDIRGKIIQTLMTVTVLPSPRGRKAGGGYFDPSNIQISWRTA